MDADVLVVGAGPAGAAASIFLARQGHRVLLVDRAAFPRDKACAEYLSPACTAFLAQLGVLDAVLAASPQRLRQRGARAAMSPVSRASRCAASRSSSPGARASRAPIRMS